MTPVGPETVTLTEAARILHLSPRRLRTLCAESRVLGAYLVGPGLLRRSWAIPAPPTLVNHPLPPGRPRKKQSE
jgi:hypothetical protein